MIEVVNGSSSCIDSWAAIGNWVWRVFDGGTSRNHHWRSMKWIWAGGENISLIWVEIVWELHARI